MSLEGGKPIRLTAGSGIVEHHAWSRDGSQLVVTRITDSSDAVLIHDRDRR